MSRKSENGILWQNVTWGANCVADSCKIRPFFQFALRGEFLMGLTNENVRVFSKSSPPISVSPKLDHLIFVGSAGWMYPDLAPVGDINAD